MVLPWKQSLSVGVSTFAGGAGGWMAAHLSSGIPTSNQGLEAFFGGCCLAGLVAVAHLLQPAPGQLATLVVTDPAKPSEAP